MEEMKHSHEHHHEHHHDCSCGTEGHEHQGCGCHHHHHHEEGGLKSKLFLMNIIMTAHAAQKDMSTRGAVATTIITMKKAV